MKLFAVQVGKFVSIFLSSVQKSKNLRKNFENENKYVQGKGEFVGICIINI